jgi:periplasmic divalent cation tolerance protein
VSEEILVFTTCQAKDAVLLATQLVDDKLAACVNILPEIQAVYRWKGEICRETETLLLIKSSRKIWKELEKRLRELHSYEVPEIICVPIEEGYQPYLDWLNSQLALALKE